MTNSLIMFLAILTCSSTLAQASIANDVDLAIQKANDRLSATDVSFPMTKEEILSRLDQALNELAVLDTTSLNHSDRAQKDSFSKETLYRKLIFESKVLYWKAVTLDPASENKKLLTLHQLGLERARRANELFSDQKRDFRYVEAAFYSLIHRGKMLEHDRNLNLIDKLYKLFELKKTVRKLENLKTLEGKSGKEFENFGASRFLSLLNGEACKKRHTQKVMDLSVESAIQYGRIAFTEAPSYGLNAYAYAFALSVRAEEHSDSSQDAFRKQALSVIKEFRSEIGKYDRSSVWFVEVQYEKEELDRLEREIKQSFIGGKEATESVP